MSTSRSQRIGIWVIAVVMVVGTIGSFFVVILANSNQTKDTAQQQKLYAEYLEKQKEAQAERQATLEPLEGYATEVFDAASVTELKSEVLTEGTGAALKEDSGMVINYFGWTADGKIFDSSRVKGVTTPNGDLKLNGVIKGWSEGLVGKKAGSVVKLTIPADKAYGSTDTGNGSPVGPLMFIVEVKEVK
ncbi:FKBP-type peptidyl-prolyl cis-trans isomerase [Candidatus Saccharibacteria bacterium]|nr:FKBP-type peptidyl-prolyl cis-trans isomerase [Candidatus Saccharibacteria bacterium]